MNSGTSPHVLQLISELKSSIRELKESRLASKQPPFLVLEEFADLEAKIAEVVCEVRSSRNRFAPVNFMPDEILSTIFYFLRSGNSATKAVCRVCQRWRSVAISHAALWSTIYISSEDVADDEIHFTRSKEMPLSVTISTPEVSPKLVRLLSRHSSRIKSLHLETFYETLAQISYASLNLPLLERLTITIEAGDPSDEVVLPLLFSHHPPALRHLTVAFFSSWQIESFVNLTTLHLRDRSRAVMTIGFFIDVLVANPGLQELKIKNHGPVLGADPVPLPRIVKLPHLHHVFLEYCDSFLLLSHISSEPKRIDIVDNVMFNWKKRGQLSTHSFGALPINYFHQSDRTRPKELRITSNVQGLSLSITDASGSAVTFSESAGSLDLDEACLASNQLHKAIELDIFRGLTHLIVDAQNEAGYGYLDSDVAFRDEWQLVLAHFAWLEYLEAKHTSLGTLISHLSVFHYDRLRPADRMVYCENLGVLRLTLPLYSSRQEQIDILQGLDDLIAFRDPSRNKSFSSGGLSEVELVLRLDYGDCILPQIHEHLTRWKSCGVGKVQVFNYEILVSSFVD